MTITQSTSEVLKVDTLGRVRTPQHKRAEILAASDGSGMTGQQFAAYVGMKYSTLMSWVGDERRKKPAATETSQTPVLNWVEAIVEKENESEVLSVEIGGGVEMKVGNKRQATLAGEIIRSLGVLRTC